MSVTEVVKKITTKIRNEIYGKQIREALAQGVEIAGDISDEANKLADDAKIRSIDTQNRFNDQIAGNTNINEVIDARRPYGADIAYPTISNRLDATDIELVNHEVKLMDHEITPDDFEGDNDCLKIQSALNTVRHTQAAIRLTRMYDLTGLPPLYVRKGSTSDRRPVRFIGAGGGFIKNDAGFMVSSETDNMGDIIFNNVRFESEEGAGTIAFDSSKLIRYLTGFCTFTNIDGVDSDKEEKNYVQSIRHIGDIITGGKGSAISVHGARDLSVFNCTIEHRENFFEQVSETLYEHGEIGNARFRDNVIEGLSGFAYKMHNVDKLTIDGDYYEANELGNIIFYTSTGTGQQAQLNGVVLANIRNSAKDETIPMVKFAGNLDNVVTYGNKSHGAPLFDFSDITNENAITSTGDKSTHPNIYGVNGLRNVIDSKINYKRVEDVTLNGNERRNITVEFDFNIKPYDAITVMQQNQLSYPALIYTPARNFSNPKQLTLWVENPRESIVTIDDIYIGVEIKEGRLV